MDKKERITTSLRLSPEETKDLKIFCLQNDTTVQDFLKHSAEYCMKNKILPKKAKK